MVQESVLDRWLSAGDAGGGRQPGYRQAREGEAGGDEQAERRFHIVQPGRERLSPRPNLRRLPVVDYVFDLR